MTKESTKLYYQVGYEYHNGEAEGTDWLTFSDERISEFQAFVTREHEEFLRRCPQDAENADLWHDWLTDAWAESDFTMDDVPHVGVVAKIMWIDLENPREE